MYSTAQATALASPALPADRGPAAAVSSRTCVMGVPCAIQISRKRSTPPELPSDGGLPVSEGGSPASGVEPPEPPEPPLPEPSASSLEQLAPAIDNTATQNPARYRLNLSMVP